MHMSDALISPAVGGVLWAATAVAGSLSTRKLAGRPDTRRTALMAVAGAFVFAAQMISFSIPGTGSSGHLGGGLLLAAVVGPHAGFLVMMSILAVQALFFADGGLLAFGCNTINLAFFSCFVAYPVIFRPLARRSFKTGTVALASVAASVIGLQLGALGAVLQIHLSGRTAVPFGSLALLMQPVHLAIGVVEGLVTASVLAVLHRARPELLSVALEEDVYVGPSLRPVIAAGVALAAVVGGVLVWFASSLPDGLEWSVATALGSTRPSASGPFHESLARIQSTVAVLPDYGFRGAGGGTARDLPAAGTTVSGLVGGAIVLLLILSVALVSRAHRARRAGAGS